MKPVDCQEQLGNAYLRERGVLESTFAEHGGEIDSSRSLRHNLGKAESGPDESSFDARIGKR